MSPSDLQVISCMFLCFKFAIKCYFVTSKSCASLQPPNRDRRCI